MDIPEAMELIKKAIKDDIPRLKRTHYENDKYPLWLAKMNDILKEAFDSSSDEYLDFLGARSRVVEYAGTKEDIKKRRYIDDIKIHELVLKKIIQRYELLGIPAIPETAEVQTPKDSAEGGGKIKAELEQFLKKLKRFRKNQIRVGDTGSSESLEKLREELIRTCVRLREVIAPPDGKLVMYQQGRVFLPFDDAFRKPIYPFGLAPQWFTSIDTLIQKTNEAIGRLEQVPVLGLPEEALYPSGAPYTAYKDIKEIISSATRALTIVDPYVDSTLFTMLEDVHPKVQIQILTQNMKGDFQLAGQKFKQQSEKAQEGTLEIRKSGKFHDRFIVADSKVFHIGASIKDAGTRACFMSEVKGADIKTTLKKAISSYWDEAEIVL